MDRKKNEPSLEWDIHLGVSLVADLSKRLTFRVIADNNLLITPDQWLVLYHLWEKDGISICQLAEKTKKDIANVSRIVDKLHQLDYVVKQKDSLDSRKIGVHVLPKGYSVRAAVKRNCGAVLASVFQNITPQEQQQFLNILSRLEKNIMETGLMH